MTEPQILHSGIEALQVVFQHSLLQDLGWYPNYLIDRAAFLQEILRQYISSIDICLLPHEVQSTFIADLEDSLYDGTTFKVSTKVKDFCIEYLNRINPQSNDPVQLVSNGYYFPWYL